MLQNIAIFFLFLGPLIFFHELGHFLFARLAGVRVEVFSIGFGPKILRFKRGDTEYAISIIPLGGYVKMFGDDPYNEAPLTDEEKKVAFNHKSKWARFWIVFGGPLANLIMAFFLYWGLVLSGERVPEVRMGTIPAKGLFYDAGFRTGDSIKAINGKKVLSYDDITMEASSVDTVTVNRHGNEVILTTNMTMQEFVDGFSKYTMSQLRRPIFIGRDKKIWLASNSASQINEMALEELLQSSQIYFFEVKDLEKVEVVPQSAFHYEGSDIANYLKERKLYPYDLVVESIVMGSPADKAGIKQGDVLVKFNDFYPQSFEDIRTSLQDMQGNISVTVVRDGQEKAFILSPSSTEVDKKMVKTIGVYSAIKVLAPKMIETTPSGFFAGLQMAWDRTIDGIGKTIAGYKKLITNEVGLKNIGGVLTIGKGAADSLQISLSMFFRLMAMISINLGIVNLLPVPVLDGGHIVFLVLETLNGGPLSRRKMEIAQRFGMSFLFFLIFVSLFNDITRYFS